MNRPISITDLAAHGDKFANLSILRREKKRPRERIAIAAANLQNLQLVHIVANAKKDTASARKGPRVRDAIGVANLQKHEICKFWRAAQNEIHKEKSYNNNQPPTARRHETMVLST